MSLVCKAKNKQNFTNIAYEKIKNAIINSELNPGDHLNAPYLAAALGMSRTPVREALKMLEKDWLVESRGVGVYVKHMTLKELYDLTNVRAALECEALKEAVNNINAEEINAIENKWLALKKNLDEGQAVKYKVVNALDFELHSLITTKSHNSFLISINESISHITSRYRQVLESNLEDMRNIVAENIKIINSLKQGNPGETSELLYRHIKNGAEEMAKAL
jgi:DNA-binding GntR family transcriptional regulator